MLTKSDLSQISGLLDKKLKVELKPIHKKLDKLQDDLNTTISFFDRSKNRIMGVL